MPGECLHREPTGVLSQWQVMSQHSLANVIPRSAAADTADRNGCPVVRNVVDADHRELLSKTDRGLHSLRGTRGIDAATRLDRRAEHHVDDLLLGQRAELRLP